MFALNEVARQHPDQSVSSSVFPNNETMQLDLYQVANLLLFLDPYALQIGYERSDFVPAGTILPSDTSQSDSGPDAPEGEFDFSYMTAADYRGHLDAMLDELIVRYPGQTIPADALPSNQTVQVTMSSVANLLIFLDPFLDNLGWSPSVFEPDA